MQCKPTLSAQSSRVFVALCHFACAMFIGLVAASAWGEEPILGQSSEYSAGPYSFKASPNSFGGHLLGYAEAGSGVKPFAQYRAYQACALSQDEPGVGDCHDWKLLDSKSGRLLDLRLPQFDAFWSDPAFSWPYVAYVKLGQLHQESWQTDVHCVVFDYDTKKLIRQQRKRISANYFETDFPGLFPPPHIGQSDGTTRFTFPIATSERSETLCAISVP